MIYGGAQAAPAKSVVRADRGGSGVRADMPGASVFAAPPEERGRLGGHCSSRRAAFCGVKKNVAFVALGTNGLRSSTCFFLRAKFPPKLPARRPIRPSSLLINSTPSVFPIHCRPTLRTRTATASACIYDPFRFRGQSVMAN